jgi:hypothetical protein
MSEECKGDLCQADRSVKGKDGIAPEGALQAGDSGDAFPLPSTLRAIAHLIGGLDPVAAQAVFGAADILEQVVPREMRVRMQNVELRNALREICDSAAMVSVEDCRAVAEEALCRVVSCSKRQSPIEERSDTVTAEQPGAGLTQKFEARAQEIAVAHLYYPDLCQGEHDALLQAISTALSTAYEEGKAAEREACAKIIDDERDRILALEYKTEDQFGHSVNTNLRMAAVKFPDLAAAIRSRKDTDDA